MSGFVPDYNRQVESSGPLAPGSADPNRKPDYNKQGDVIQSPTAEDFAETRGRIPREQSGATGARSGSVSRSRDRRNPSVVSIDRRTGSTEGRVSQSPARAMGARSVSIERSPSDAARRRTGLNTIEGMGTSVGPEVNPDALDSRRGRQGYQDVTASTQRVLSPNRAMGARSVIKEEENEEQAQQNKTTQA